MRQGGYSLGRMINFLLVKDGRCRDRPAYWGFTAQFLNMPQAVRDDSRQLARTASTKLAQV